jgi:hypothetical protein
MNTQSEISVTLSSDLLNHLRAQAQRLHVPVRWLVAGLVHDTLEPTVIPVTEQTHGPECAVS